MEEENTQLIVLPKEVSGKYDIPEVRQYIKIRKQQGWSMNQIAQGLKEERGFDKISPNTCQDIYAKMVSRSVVHSTEAKEVIDDLTEEVKQSYRDAIQILGMLVKKMRLVVDEFNPTEPEAKQEVLKVIPGATGLMKSIRENMALQLSLQDSIIKEGEKQLYITPAETLDYVNKYSREMLKENARPIAERIIERYNLPKEEMKNIIRDIESESGFK